MRNAFDVLKDLNGAGVDIIVLDGDRLQWRCDPKRPPVHGDLLTELKEYKADALRILLDVPIGCLVPDTCKILGICPREIATRECTYSAGKQRPGRRERAAQQRVGVPATLVEGR